MTYIKTGVYDGSIVFADGFRFGADGRIWFCDGKRNAVCSFDFEVRKIEKHFVDDSICTFGIFGDVGAVGTIDGRVWTFRIHELPEHSPVQWFSDRNAIGEFAYDPVSESLFLTCNDDLHHVSLDGEVLNRWSLRHGAGGLQWVPQSQTIWLYCSGIEIFSLDGDELRTIKPGKFCPYCRLAVSPQGEVAAFGGDVDIFTSHGDLIRTIPGDFNGGVYGPNGRLVIKDLAGEFDGEMTITSHEDHDVISNCDRFAFNDDSTRLVVLSWGKIHTYIKET